MTAKPSTLAPSAALAVANSIALNGNGNGNGHGHGLDSKFSSLPPIAVSNRRSQAWRVLRDSIVSGRLPAGTKLIGSQLAEQLGVSRTPLREAIQLLEREGFVRRLPSGVVEVVGLNHHEIEEIYAIRARLEGLAVRYACLRASDDEILQLQMILEEMRRDLRRGDSVGLDDEGQRFHDLILQASQLTVANHQLETMRDHIDRYRAETLNSPGRLDALVEEHSEVVKWMLARRADKAEEAMERHIWNAWLTISGSATVPAGGEPGAD